LAFGRRGQFLQPAHAGFAEAFGIGHDVGLRHRNEIRRAKELADRHLMPQRFLRQRSAFSGQDVPFFVVELHRDVRPLPRRSRLLHYISCF
jgi:hypothetical protein